MYATLKARAIIQYRLNVIFYPSYVYFSTNPFHRGITVYSIYVGKWWPRGPHHHIDLHVNIRILIDIVVISAVPQSPGCVGKSSPFPSTLACLSFLRLMSNVFLHNNIILMLFYLWQYMQCGSLECWSECENNSVSFHCQSVPPLL